MNVKGQKYFNGITTIIQAILIFTLGIFILTKMRTFLGLAVYLVSFGFIGMGIIQTLKNIFPKTNKTLPIEFFYSIANIFIGAFILYKPEIFVDIFPIIFMIYVLINSVVKLVTYMIYKKNNIDERFGAIARSIVSFMFFLVLAFSPLFRDKVTFVIVGIYFIFLGLSYLLDGIDSMIPKSRVDKFKRKFRVVLPVFIAAFLPKKALDEINEMLGANRSENIDSKLTIIKEAEDPDIEVFVHMGKKGFGTFGHVDLYYQKKVISYGSYDEANVVLGSSIGDGVLFETDKEKYIEFCNTQADKTLVGFGLRLTDAQKMAIDNRFKKIKDLTYPWEPKAKLEKDKTKTFTDYASKLYLKTGAKFWKFKSGKFKTYFVMNTNCVQLADQLIGASGIDIIKLSGIITPGTYYDYFNREFERENSFVISKNIYLER